MDRLRTTPATLRAMLAAAFWFMGAVHAPLVITTAAAAENAAASLHAHHHVPDTASHDRHVNPGEIDDAGGLSKSPSPACASFDCCVAVTPPAIAACAPGAVLLTTLKPLPPDSISPVTPERTDPPPRLHV